MIYRFSLYELDEEKRELRRRGERLTVEPLIFDLLALLIRNHNRVVSKSEIMETLWPDVIVTEASLQRAVSIARRALNDDSRTVIQTFTGYGYRFSGDVREEDVTRIRTVEAPPLDDAQPEPAIRYARTEDGVSIAFWSIGRGAPLVCMTNLIWSHAQLEWRFPEIRRWFQRLAKKRQVVRFDPRGTGLSERHLDDYSIEALSLDLEAVVSQLGLDKFALLAAVNAGPLAVQYTVEHPERVSHLILWSTWTGVADYQDSRWQALAALQPLMERDWQTYTETRAHAELGWVEPELAHRYAAFLRECTTPEMARRAYLAIDGMDIERLLPVIRTPTLVAHRRQFSLWADEEVSKNIAARIQDSRLVSLNGQAAAPYLGNADAELPTIESFLDESTSGEPAIILSGTATILFADIVDSTGLTERLGDAAFREKARDLDAALRALIREHNGTPIEGKLLGDGVLATFASARQAIEAALACAAAGDGCGLPLHLGLHAGDVIREENNVYGGAVNIAARIAGESAPGEVLVSQTVRDLARTSAGVRFEDRGEQSLKGVGEPVRVWVVKGETDG